MALTNEQILKEIKEAMKANGDTKVIVNEALTHAMTAIQNMDKKLAEEYECGGQDAINLVRRIREPVARGGYTATELVDIFGHNYATFVLDELVDFKEAIAKVEVYENKKRVEEEEAQKLVRGDEVVCCGGKTTEFKGLFYGEGCNCYYILDPTSAAPQTIGKDWKLTKTGKHVDLF